jgi:hypothetical protein
LDKTMSNSLTATHHTLNFNSLSYDKFEGMCFWLVDDSGEYEKVEHYGGTGDKNRDVIGYTPDGEVDYYQCKRYEGLTHTVLKGELESLGEHIKAGTVKKPRRIYFVLSSSVSANAKDQAKHYATENDLPEPAFWEPIILDKKIRKNADALINFFNIKNESKEEHLPQVDTTGLIAYGTHETTFTVVNNGDIPAIDCSWSLVGFGWPGYMGGPTVFDLNPGQKLDLRIAIQGQFMGEKPIKELRLRFKFRDSKNNWYFSERYLVPELVARGSFYRINAVAGRYMPTRPTSSLFNIDAIERFDRIGLNETRLVTYTHEGITKTLKINVSTTLLSIWQFTGEELESAFAELAEKRITQMIKNGKFEDEFGVTTYLKSTQNNGYEGYKELRDSIT